MLISITLKTKSWKLRSKSLLILIKLTKTKNFESFEVYDNKTRLQRAIVRLKISNDKGITLRIILSI